MDKLQAIFIICSIVLLGYLVYHQHDTMRSFFVGELKHVVQIGGVKFFVQVADTDEERRQGLSGTESLGDFEGLLFVFDEVDRHGIWMKDMNYPIDIIWIDDDQWIVHIEETVDPSTYPRSFRPPRPARYVLEVNANVTDAFNIKPGQRVLIPEEITREVLP